MAKSKLEYIWLDGYKPTQSLRSKTKIENNFSGKLEDLDMWSFDGSSTQQAEGGFSDCLLKPVYVCPDPARRDGFLVMCEVLNADGTPHVSNGRATIEDDDNDFWFGFEQEYFLWDPETNKPLGFPANGYPEPQGQYYCSVGAKNAFGREIIEEHMDLCIDAGLNIEGINAEVAAGQWEFQMFAKGSVMFPNSPRTYATSPGKRTLSPTCSPALLAWSPPFQLPRSSWTMPPWRWPSAPARPCRPPRNLHSACNSSLSAASVSSVTPPAPSRALSSPSPTAGRFSPLITSWRILAPAPAAA